MCGKVHFFKFTFPNLTHCYRQCGKVKFRHTLLNKMKERKAKLAQWNSRGPGVLQNLSAPMTQGYRRVLINGHSVDVCSSSTSISTEPPLAVRNSCRPLISNVEIKPTVLVGERSSGVILVMGESGDYYQHSFQLAEFIVMACHYPPACRHEPRCHVDPQTNPPS